MADTQSASGSPDGEPEYLVVGFLQRPHGVRGEIIMELHTDFPERLKPGRKLYIGTDHEPRTLSTVRPHPSGMLVKWKGLNTTEEAARFRNQWVFVRASEVPVLPQGQLYQHQLIGLLVVDEHGTELGELAEILETGANDVYVVRNGSGRELLLPAIESVIMEVDLKHRRMRVHLLEGL